MVASRRFTLMIRNGFIIGSPFPPSHCHFGSSKINCFSSLYDNQGSNNWRDDIRAGVRSDGRKDTLKDDVDRATESTRDAADATRDAAGSVADIAKEATVKGLETGLNLGEKAKQTLNIAWDGAMQTAQNVKDNLAGDQSDAVKGRGQYQTNEPIDSDVERSKKRVAESDFKH